MDTNKEAPGIDRERIPETITFRTADRMTYGALGYDGNVNWLRTGCGIAVRSVVRIEDNTRKSQAIPKQITDFFFLNLQKEITNAAAAELRKALLLKKVGHSPR